jgi:photosystem II protein PsbQ
MKIFRPILSLILVLATTLLVSCSGPSASAPPTYNAERLQQIKTYRIPVDVAQQKLSELGKFISVEDWVNTKTFIHGPLGSIRRDMTYLANTLLPADKAKASELAKGIFDHLEDLDAAAKNQNYPTAIGEYKQLVSDFEIFLGLVPQTKKPEQVFQGKKAMKRAENVFAGFKQEVKEAIEEITPDSDG